MDRLQRAATAATVALFAMPPALAAQDRPEFTAPRAAQVSAAGARVGRIEARAGRLRIEGRAGITEIRPAERRARRRAGSSTRSASSPSGAATLRT
jgi:hypothetical protein